MFGLEAQIKCRPVTSLFFGLSTESVGDSLSYFVELGSSPVAITRAGYLKISFIIYFQDVGDVLQSYCMIQAGEMDEFLFLCPHKVMVLDTLACTWMRFSIWLETEDSLGWWWISFCQ